MEIQEELTDNEIQLHLDQCEWCREHEHSHAQYEFDTRQGRWVRFDHDTARILIT